MSHTSTNILRDLSIQNHNLWIRINTALNKVLNKFKVARERPAAEVSVPPIDETKPDRFMQAIKRIEFKYGYEPHFSPQTPYGYFKGRHVIGENTKISGGIFVSPIAAETLVLDEKYGILSEIYMKLIAKISLLDNQNVNYEYNVFSKVVSLTRETLRYSEESVDNIRKHYNLQQDEKVSLDLYIKKKVGVSRHQVLLASFLLEKLKEKFLIKGTFWIDSTISEDVRTERLIFKSADGEIFRFDPTKGLGKTAIH